MTDPRAKQLTDAIVTLDNYHRDLRDIASEETLLALHLAGRHLVGDLEAVSRPDVNVRVGVGSGWHVPDAGHVIPDLSKGRCVACARDSDQLDMRRTCPQCVEELRDFVPIVDQRRAA